MFCKNCGSEILDGDKFCGSCGCPKSEDLGESRGEFTPKKGIYNGIISVFKNYFIKPVSFFSELKNEEVLKSSIILLLGLPIIYGLLNIIYVSSVINSAFSIVKKLPMVLANAKIISEQEALKASKELMFSNEVLEAKNKINAFLDNKDIFINGFCQIFVIVILTAIILAILNAIILKNNIKPANILFISTASYIPLVISMALTSLATLISIIFGLFIMGSGYILSFITLYSGIKQISEEKNDRVFIIMIILFIICSAILAIFITNEIESSLMSTINIFSSFKSII